MTRSEIAFAISASPRAADAIREAAGRYRSRRANRFAKRAGRRAARRAARLIAHKETR